MKIDDGHKALETLARTYGQLDLASASEAETRFHVIDEVLSSVLGWHKDDITVEERTTGSGHARFADYVLRTAATSLVIEAKRAGAAFSLPPHHRTLSLKGVLATGETGDAIRQVRDYCVSLSIPFAVATNGNAWIIFAANRTDGVPFDQGTAHVFRDLDEIREHFVDFWEMLSRERVVDGNLGTILLGGKSEKATDSRNLRSLLPEPGFRLGRNSVYEHIEPAVVAALSDEALLLNDEALEACYIKTSERAKFDSRLRMHLADSKPPLEHPVERVKRRKGSAALDRQIATPAVTPRFIVLLGPVGAGKTTFLTYTRRISAAAEIAGKILWLLIDFKKSTPSDDPRTFIYGELLRQIDCDTEFELGDWRRSIRPAYRELADTLRRGVLYPLASQEPEKFDLAVSAEISKERDRVEPFVDRLLSWSSTKRPSYLVIDNVDQIDSPDIQQNIFLEAQAIARRLGCHVIMSMREATYLRHRTSPVFDAFQFDALYVDPPSVTPVLSNRFKYAQKTLQGRSTSLLTEGGMRINVPDLGVFFDIVSSSLLREETAFLFEALAGGDIRRGLSLVRDFLQSGHTNADRALAAFLADGDYHFPRHEVFRGAVLGQFRYFSDSHSLLPNIYDARLASKILQLLRLRIAHFLVEHSSNAGYEGTPLTEIHSAMEKVGIPRTELDTVLFDLHAKRVIRTKDGLDLNESSMLLPTRLAGYILRVLCSELAYSEFCALDSTIFDDDKWHELRDRTLEIETLRAGSTEQLAERVGRIRIFMDYVRQSDERWVIEARRHGLGDPWTTEILNAQAISDLNANLERALESSRKARARRRNTATGPEMRGQLVRTWLDKDYVFIRGDDGVDWFAHRNDFRDEDSWSNRREGLPCMFRDGQYQGKPRAVDVTLEALAADQ